MKKCPNCGKTLIQYQKGFKCKRCNYVNRKWDIPKGNLNK